MLFLSHTINTFVISFRLLNFAALGYRLNSVSGNKALAPEYIKRKNYTVIILRIITYLNNILKKVIYITFLLSQMLNIFLNYC